MNQNYLAHFTKNGVMSVLEEDNPTNIYTEYTAIRRLISILELKKIFASNMPWTNARAVCFTECPWAKLISHTEKYSPFGVGFSKACVFAKHGGPVYYMRPDHFKKQMKQNKFDNHVWPFVTPFSPSYRPKHMKKTDYFPTVDFSHEMEWRVPHDFPFEYSDIEFIILPNYTAMAQFPKDLKDSIGREKFILMDNYKKIEELWPVHILK